MIKPRLKVLVTGATGRVGREVVSVAARAGHHVRALVRDPAAMKSNGQVEVIVGNLERSATLGAALDDIGAIVFAHGTYGSASAAETVDYGGVYNILAALDGRKLRIAQLTTIGVTDGEVRHNWKRRAERLVRASGAIYTIVRPGWFDLNTADQLQLSFLQGDKRQSGTPRDGVIARSQIAEVLVQSLSAPGAANKTLELVAEMGRAQENLEPLFAALDRDASGALDAIHDAANLPLEREPERFTQDLVRLTARLTAVARAGA